MGSSKLEVARSQTIQAQSLRRQQLVESLSRKAVIQKFHRRE